jgi:histidyl-tRNA synthetase
MSRFSALPGFRDFYPEDLAVRQYIFRTWREVARRYGFQEFDGPPLEPIELYVKESGPEILEQTYNFTDRGDRHVALRPEMTPTFARMVGARVGGMRKPVKWYAIPQLFRYERQQRGRLREHFQLNLDIVGEEGAAADAELLAAAIDTLRAFRLTEEDFVARISDRRLLRVLLLDAGVPEGELVLVYNLVDKLDREGRDAVATRLAEEAGLAPDVVDGVLEPFEHATFDDFTRWVESRGAEVREELEEVLADMRSLFDALEAMGLGGFLRFDLSVVRGLGYYTGIVWELFDARGELRAIAGGGRYDGLLAAVGGTDLPALGFGMGDVVLRELLADRNLLPDTARATDYYLVSVTEGERGELVRLAHRLREAGRSVEYGYRQQGVGKQFKNAAAAGARRTVVLGPDEVAAGEVVVREMGGGEERRLSFDALVAGA